MSTIRAASPPGEDMSQGDFSEKHTARAGEVVSFWLMAFVMANIASAIVVVLCGYANSTVGDTPSWVFALSAMSMWLVYLVVVHRFVTSRISPNFSDGIGLVVRRSDLWGVPIGVASQLLLVNAVNWPLSKLFPGTFNFDEVSERARDLASASPGAWVILLAVIVVIGAPVVEEIVYRGMVQPGLVASWGLAIGTVVTAAGFAAIHLAPVEFPGLFAFALVLGWGRNRSGRLGLPIVMHMAFNATGLWLALIR